MKRWLGIEQSVQPTYVAADTEAGARQRFREKTGVDAETIEDIGWPERCDEPEVVEIRLHHYGISLRAMRPGTR